MPLRSRSYQNVVRSAPRGRIPPKTTPVKEILTLFPLSYWTEASAVPVKLDKTLRRCRLAMADDEYGLVADDVAFVSGYKVDVVRTSKATIKRLLASVEGQR